HAAQRRRAAEARGCRGSDHARSALPVLRLDHAHHRNIRGWPGSTTPADRNAGRYQDRHVMTALHIRLRCHADPSRQSMPGRAEVRPKWHLVTLIELRSAITLPDYRPPARVRPRPRTFHRLQAALSTNTPASVAI